MIGSAFATVATFVCRARRRPMHTDHETNRSPCARRQCACQGIAIRHRHPAHIAAADIGRGALAPGRLAERRMVRPAANRGSAPAAPRPPDPPRASAAAASACASGCAGSPAITTVAASSSRSAAASSVGIAANCSGLPANARSSASARSRHAASPVRCQSRANTSASRPMPAGVALSAAVRWRISGTSVASAAVVKNPPAHRRTPPPPLPPAASPAASRRASPVASNSASDARAMAA